MSEIFHDRQTETRGVPRALPEDADAPLFDDRTIDRLAELLFSDDTVFATFLHFLPNAPQASSFSLQDIEQVYRDGPRRLTPLAARQLLTADPEGLALLREKLHKLNLKLPQPWVQEMVRLVGKNPIMTPAESSGPESEQ